MPNISIYLPEDMNEKLETAIPEDTSRSEWVQHAIKRELENEHDELEDLTRQFEELTDRVEELEGWRRDAMEEIVQHFYGEHGPAN